MVAARRAQLAGWIGLAGLALVSAAAWAQEEPAAPRPAARAMTAHREANVVLVNGEPTLLTWARGLEDPADVAQYAATGMSAVYVVIQGVSEEELESASVLASAAEAKGMMVVAALAPRALLDEGGSGPVIASRAEDYAAAVRAFVQQAAEKLGAHPGLVAWSVEAVASGQAVWTEDGFRTYLADGYGSVAALNNSWGTQFAGWEQITATSARDIDQTKPGGLGRATVDLAYYQEAAYADALSVWARAVRQADPGRLVLASALTDYRSIISVRTDFDGMVLNTYPSLAELDWRTHNVHAVDIARRASGSPWRCSTGPRAWPSRTGVSCATRRDSAPGSETYWRESRSWGDSRRGRRREPLFCTSPWRAERCGMGVGSTAIWTGSRPTSQRGCSLWDGMGAATGSSMYWHWIR